MMAIYPVIKQFVKLYYKFMFRMDIQGQENVPEHGGVVMCCNHMSNYDPFTMAAFTKREVRYIAKKELFQNPFLKRLMYAMKAFPVDREAAMDMKALKTAMKILKDGEVLGIFAEGTRVKEGEAKAAKAGVALFALKGNAPIVPVAVSSTHKFRAVVHIRYGEPVYLDEYKGQKVTTELMEEITEKVMQKVREMKVPV